MDKWFDPKFERNYRRYTKRRLNSFGFYSFFRRFSVTTWIILVNIVVFIFAFLFMGIFGVDKVLSIIALQPNAFFNGAVWNLLTSMFTHTLSIHLVFNMVSLFFIGNFVEKLIGRKRLFWFYMLSGLIAGLFFVVLAYFFGVPITNLTGLKFGSLEWIRFGLFGSSLIPAVGASGAIFGLAGLLMILTPNLRVYVFFIIPMRMWTAMVVLLCGFWLLSIFSGFPIGNSAHLGGLLVGVVYALYLKRKYKRKTALISRYFSG